jgi:hypothetical protein
VIPVERIDPRTGRLDLAVLDLRRLTLYPIASVYAVSRTCRATTTHLACPARPDEIRIWRYAR